MLIFRHQTIEPSHVGHRIWPRVINTGMPMRPFKQQSLDTESAADVGRSYTPSARTMDPANANVHVPSCNINRDLTKTYSSVPKIIGIMQPIKHDGWFMLVRWHCNPPACGEPSVRGCVTLQSKSIQCLCCRPICSAQKIVWSGLAWNEHSWLLWTDQCPFGMHTIDLHLPIM